MKYGPELLGWLRIVGSINYGEKVFQFLSLSNSCMGACGCSRVCGWLGKWNDAGMEGWRDGWVDEWMGGWMCRIHIYAYDRSICESHLCCTRHGICRNLLGWRRKLRPRFRLFKASYARRISELCKRQYKLLEPSEFIIIRPYKPRNMNVRHGLLLLRMG